MIYNKIWNFFFVGTNSHLKLARTDAYLSPLIGKYNGILAGVGWPVGVGEMPLQDSSLMYNFAKIYPNYHLDNQVVNFNEVNERAFIIPACGGFELTDNPKAMRELFRDDEMAIADTPDQFAEMFDHYMSHPDERLELTRRGMNRVWKEYTLFHVLSRLIQFLDGSWSEALPETSKQKIRVRA